MIRFSRTLVFAIIIGLVPAVFAWADPPRIDGISPFGVKKGTAANVTISGANLAGRPRLIAPFNSTIAPPTKPATDAAKWVFSLDVAPETPIGVYLVRVQTDDGISNPFLFTVGQLPQVEEKEVNSRFESAQIIATPCVVEGQTAGTDVDYFKFSGKKGERIVIDAQCARIGSGIDPSIRLTTALKRFLASADDTPGLQTDARMMAVLPEDGDYVVEISDSSYKGTGRAFYRLVVGALPMAEEIYPLGGRIGEAVGVELRGGTIGDPKIGAVRFPTTPGLDSFSPRLTTGMLGITGPTLEVESLPKLVIDDAIEVRESGDPAAPPTRATPPVVLNGRIESKGDTDTFVLAVTPGQKLRFDVAAADLGSSLDPVLQVQAIDGAVLASADDMTAPPKTKTKGKPAGPPIISPDPKLDYTVSSNRTEIKVMIKDLKGDGGTGYAYRIKVSPIASSFDIVLDDTQATIPKGGSVAIPVTIDRKGYTGPLTLEILNPPAGLSVQNGLVNDGQVAGILTVSAAADTTLDLLDLHVVGKAQTPAGPVVQTAKTAITFASQGPIPTNVVEQVGLPVAIGLPTPVRFDMPTAPVEVVHGFGGSVPVKTIRDKGADAALTIAALPPPTGLTVPNATIADKANAGTATVNAAVEAPVGRSTIVLTAKGKLGGKDTTLTLPAVTIDVVRPAAIELASAATEIKPGTTIELKGKLVRRGAFKEAVGLKLDGLPAGLKADPVTVAPDKSEFTMKLTADAKAAPATASAKISASFQLNKKDYPTPPAPLAVKVVAAK